MPRSLPPASQAAPAAQSSPAAANPRGPTAVNKPPVAAGAPEPDAGAGLPLPHEHDESTGEVGSQPHPIMEQAKRDVDAGLVDTDKRSATGLADEPAGGPAASKRSTGPQPTSGKR